MSAPDFEKLRAIGAELTRLETEGKLTRAEYDRLLAEGDAAVGERTEFLEGILARGMRLGFVSS